MICYYRNSISCGANRREFEDQSVIKGKLKANGIRPSGYLILGIFGREKKCREREKKKKTKKKKKKKKKKRKKGMETICVWIAMGLYGY